MSLNTCNETVSISHIKEMPQNQEFKFLSCETMDIKSKYSNTATVITVENDNGEEFQYFATRAMEKILKKHQSDIKSLVYKGMNGKIHEVEFNC